MASESQEAKDPSSTDAGATPGSPGGAAPSASDETADTKAQVTKLTDEKRDLNDRLLRLAAEFENYKRRSRKEFEDASVRGLEPLLKELLPALDNLDRAVTAAKTANVAGAAPLLEGVQLVQKQFLVALEKHQIKPFESEGKPFDPNFHEAVAQVDSETQAPGTVATVFQRGYMAGNKLLRPAMVSVVRARPQSTPESTIN